MSFYKNLRSEFFLEQHSNILVVFDLDRRDKMSVTNDAENVVPAVCQIVFPKPWKRLIYRDSMGRFDELIVKNKGFGGYYPIGKEFLGDALDAVDCERDGEKVLTLRISAEGWSQMPITFSEWENQKR